MRRRVLHEIMELSRVGELEGGAGQWQVPPFPCALYPGTVIQKLGLIADTRGAVLPDAVEVFARQRVDVILHAGNVGSASDALAPLEAVAPVIAVTGSEDEAIHHRLPWDLRLSFGGRRVFLCHEYDDSGRVVQEWQPHVLVYGHTEDAGIERRGSTLFVHPGRAERSVATLDLSGLEAEIHPTLADRG